MFTVTVESTFAASHQVTMPDGVTEPLHSHDWIVRVAVAAEQLDDYGLAMDFIELKALIDRVLAPLIGTKLEGSGCFDGINASAENVTKYIFDRVEPALGGDVKLVFVEVMEAAGCWTKYSR